MIANHTPDYPPLRVQIPTASSIPVGIEALSSVTATPATLKKTLAWCETMGQVFDPENVGVSLGLAEMLNIGRILDGLASSDFSVSSLDLPEIIPPAELMEKVIIAFLGKQHAPHEPSPSLSQRIDQARRHVGWSRLNVSTRQALLGKLYRALPALPRSHRLVTANAALFLETPRLARDIVRRLPNNTTVAVEPNPNLQTPNEYLLFVSNLRKRSKRINFAMDFDVGQMMSAARNEQKKRKPSAQVSNELVIEIFKSVLKNPMLRPMLAMVTLNSLAQDSDETHGDLLSDNAIFMAISALMGEAAANNKLSYPPTIMPEASPADYDQHISQTGKSFWRSIRLAYDQAAAGKLAKPTTAPAAE